MNKFFDIIPTPKNGSFVAGNALVINTFFVDAEIGNVLESALNIFENEYYIEVSEKNDADLIITNKIDNISFFEEKNAKSQGYILKKDSGKPVILQAKSDLGLAYGLMTLLQIMNKKIDSFFICDSPDIEFRGNKWLLWNETEVWSYDFGDGIEAFKKRIVRKFDMCLKFKINMVFFDGWGADIDRTPEYKSLMKFCCQEARKRGIYLIFGAYTMGYGLSAHSFGKHFGKVYKNIKDYPNGEEYECLGTYKKDPYDDSIEPYVTGRTFGTCISNKSLMKAKLDELKTFIREVQPGALYLHNMDSHVIEPMLWEARCDECRKRWPNDDLFAKDGMAGAFAEFFDELNSGLQSVKSEGYDSAEDLLLFNVSPGYMWYVCKDGEIEQATKFWNAVKKYSKVKKNVYPLFRELFFNKNDNKMRFPDVVSKLWEDKHGFGIINFSGGGGFYTDKLFFASSVFNYMFEGTEALITCSGSAFQEPLQVFNAEYMWNTKNSGFYNLTERPQNDKEFMKLYVDSRNAKFRPEEIFGEGKMIDVICEKLYGEHSKLMSGIFKLCGKNAECIAPYACSKETFTAGNDVIIKFRWDNELPEEEIEELTERFSEIERLNVQAQQMFKMAENLTPDLKSFRDMLSLNNYLVSFWNRYLQLYAMTEKFVKEGKGDKNIILSLINVLLEEVRTEHKRHKEMKFEYVDAMLGALARREEMLEVQEYNLELMIQSIETNKRIPDNRKILHKEIWW